MSLISYDPTLHLIVFNPIVRRLNERMRAGVSQPSGGEERDSAIGNIAMLRAQKAMAERLSTVGRCNLPDGIMLHDDPMSKTNAFLSQMPALT